MHTSNPIEESACGIPSLHFSTFNTPAVLLFHIFLESTKSEKAMFLHKRSKYFGLSQRHSGASECCQVSSASRFQFVFNTCITSALARRIFKLFFFLLIWLEKVKKTPSGLRSCISSFRPK